MKARISIKDMYSAAGGISKSGWYGAGLVMPDLDLPWMDQIEAVFFPAKDFSTGGVTFDEFFAKHPRPEEKTAQMPQEWIQNVTKTPRSLVMFDSGKMLKLTEAERIYGPCIPSGVTPKPCISWIEKNNGKWKLRFWDGQQITDVFESFDPLATPSVAVWNGEPVFAAACGKYSLVFIPGKKPVKLTGKYPMLAANRTDAICVCERAERNEGSISLWVTDLKTGGEIPLCQDELNLHAHTMELNDRFYIVFESKPSWGIDHRLTQTGEICLATWTNGKIERVEILPQRRMGFREFRTDDSQSIYAGYPRLFTSRGQIGVAVRRFRADIFRGNTWDVEISTCDGKAWTPFERVTEQPGTSDTGYSLFEYENELMGLFPTHGECDSSREFDTRTELVAIGTERLPPFDPPKALRMPYQYTISAAGIGKGEDEELRVSGFCCKKGDIHVHSVYSKCMSSVDGAPSDLARWYIDLLGMDILSIADHTDRIGYPQFTWLMDTLEELSAGQADLLYGMEPSIEPDQDTNYYTYDREKAEVLRLTGLYSLRRKHVYESIRCHFLPGEVAAIRHCHGRTRPENGIHSQETLRTFTSDLEWAMEALQLRGNIVLGESFSNPEEHFPCNFLNHGAGIGLVGGTDHDTAMVVNHLGYTGFWTDKPGAKGLMEAIRQRRTFAVSNGHAQIWTEFDGQPMGTDMGKVTDVQINVIVHAAYPVRRATLLRDGELLPWQEANSEQNWQGVLCDRPGPGKHWYIVVVECDSIFTLPDIVEGHGRARKLPLMGKAGFQNRNETCTVFASPYFVNVMDGDLS